VSLLLEVYLGIPCAGIIWYSIYRRNCSGRPG
jgi:hypothetical protein